MSAIPEDPDPFPECPPFPKGITLRDKRRIVSEWGKLTEHWRLRQAKKCGVEWMTWVTTGLPDVCESCNLADGVAVEIEDFDINLHRANCGCPDGCGCVCGPIRFPEPPSGRSQHLRQVTIIEETHEIETDSY